MELIDSHAHLDFRHFDKDRDRVILRAKREGVSTILNVGSDIESSRASVRLAGSRSGIWAAVGIHPHSAKDVDSEILREIERLASREKVLAIGEIGLDYHYDNSPRDIQKRVFRTQLRLARKLNLPVIIHSREADRDTLQILREEQAQELGGIMHCFAGDWEMARKCLEMNFYLAFGGVVTFNSAEKTREVVARMPLEYLLLETDCPYLAPHPYRGKRNEPAYVKYVAEKISKIRNISQQKVAEVTSQNFRNLFKLDQDE